MNSFSRVHRVVDIKLRVEELPFANPGSFVITERATAAF